VIKPASTRFSKPAFNKLPLRPSQSNRLPSPKRSVRFLPENWFQGMPAGCRESPWHGHRQGTAEPGRGVLVEMANQWHLERLAVSDTPQAHGVSRTFGAIIHHVTSAGGNDLRRSGLLKPMGGQSWSTLRALSGLPGAILRRVYQRFFSGVLIFQGEQPP